jgi:hypothetical protein
MSFSEKKFFLAGYTVDQTGFTLIIFLKLNKIIEIWWHHGRNEYRSGKYYLFKQL